MTRSRVHCFVLSRSILASFVSLTFLLTPIYGAPSASLGTIVYANRAHVGAAQASVGATVFGGDRLSTEQPGSVQVRVGAARLLLASSSSATFTEDATPAATLTIGSATFSTANSKAFALHVASAVVRPNVDEPTIGQVTLVRPKELIVKCTRGSLLFSVEDDVRVIPEGAAYHVYLDPTEAQGPQGAGTKGYGGAPIKAARSKFIWYAVGTVALITFFAVQEALESPDRP
jgi:hypothetical protein